MKLLLNTVFAALLFLNLASTGNGQSIEKSNLPLQLIDDVEVASMDEGVVALLRAVPGMHVKKGDVLLELDRELQTGRTNVKNMAWRVADAEASNDVNVRYSQKTLFVNAKLLEKSLNATKTYAKSISETEIDKQRLERDQSELSIEQAMFELEAAKLTANLRDEELNLARIELDRRTLRSPLDGIVVDVQAQVGEAVAAAKPVIRIISTKRLRVIANVDRKFAFKLHSGDAATFVLHTEDGPETFQAHVVFVSPEIRFTEQTFDVWVEVQNAESKLLPGMKGDLTIKIKEANGL